MSDDIWTKCKLDDEFVPSPQEVLAWAEREFRKEYPDAFIIGVEVVNEGDGPKIVFNAINLREDVK